MPFQSYLVAFIFNLEKLATLFYMYCLFLRQGCTREGLKPEILLSQPPKLLVSPADTTMPYLSLLYLCIAEFMVHLILAKTNENIL